MVKKPRPFNLVPGIAISDNKLVNACYRMTSVQKRLFNMAIASCHSQAFMEQGEVSVSIEDFAELAGKQLWEAMRVCRQEAKNMSKLQVINIVYKEKRYKNDPFVNQTKDMREGSEKEVGRVSYKNFFQEVEYVDVDGICCLYFKFSEWLLPYVEAIKQKFAQVPLVEVSKLGSFYSLRLFDFVMASKEVGKSRKRVFSYDEYREILGFVEDNKELYSNWCDFRKRCLVTPIAELNKKTNYDWSYKITGRGDISRRIAIIATKRNQLSLNLEDSVH